MTSARRLLGVRLGLLLLALWPLAGRAAVLDVAEDGADLVFTWDTGTDNLLRGTSPDNLQPWLTFVSSPLRVPNENLLRGEDAFYRIASGSNMAYRIERTFDVPDPVRPLQYAVTLPERHAFTTAFDLLQRWPTLLEIIWIDGPQSRWESATRKPDGLPIGDDEPVPQHGGVWLAFTTTTTLTLVGSSDDTLAGVVIGDFFGGVNVLAVPPDSRRLRVVDILCGAPGVDWFDINGDGNPDECGTDTDGDTLPDTGLYAGTSLTLVGLLPPDDYLAMVRDTFPLPPSDRVVGNVSFEIQRGEALTLRTNWPPTFNAPFRPPRW